jgi:azurin
MNYVRTLAFVTLIAASSGAFAAPKVCKVEITGNDIMQFDKKEIAIAADCTDVELTIKHSGKAAANVMGHNVVLTKTADVAPVSTDGIVAGLAKNYVKDGDPRVIAHTKVIGGGQTDTVKFPTSKLKKGEAYTFFCSFPGHSSIMKGAFKF